MGDSVVVFHLLNLSSLSNFRAVFRVDSRRGFLGGVEQFIPYVFSRLVSGAGTGRIWRTCTKM